MKSKSLSLIFNYAIYALTILLIFFVVFEEYLELPRLIGWLGRWHPLILHFPIVLVFVAIIQYWRKDQAAYWYLTAATLFTLLSALTGFILSIEGDSKGNLILTHQWLGISIAIFMVTWYAFSSALKANLVRVMHGAMIILIVLTGHFGGMLTHGEEFMAYNLTSDVTLALPDNPNIYEHLVQPVFDAKCVSCHNENKAKGKLILTDYNALAKGGESGSVTTPENELIHRLLLPADHEDHMPPAKEKQLNSDELMIVKSWFELGADPYLMYADMDPESELAGIAKKMIDSGSADKWSAIPAISDAEIDKLSNEYLTIRRMYQHSDALQVLVFPQNPSVAGIFQGLKKISKNVVELSLIGLQLNKEDMKILGTFDGLEVLNIRECAFIMDEFPDMKSLKNLKVLKIADTHLGDEVITEFANFSNLSYLYVYNSNASAEGIEKMKSQIPGLQVTTRVDEADDFKAVLPVPVLEPAKYFFCQPFFISPRHPLHNVVVKYTSDGTDPVAGTLLLIDSTLIDRNVNLKYFASKEGWESSLTDSIRIFKSCIKPVMSNIENAPDEKYKGKGSQILFDLEKGPINFGDEAWMGFREKNFMVTCEFESTTTIKGVVLSSIIHTDPHLFPPERIRIYGGMNSGELRLLSTVRPSVPSDRQEPSFKYYQCIFPATSVQVIRIEVDPLRHIPVWHQGKGERAWFFIDEIVFESGDEI